MADGADQALALNLVRRVCVGDLLTRSARHRRDTLALVDGDDELSYAELDGRANSTGRALLELGLRHQEPVGILSRNSWEQVVTYFACAKAGLIALPLTLGLKPDEIDWALQRTGVRALVVEPELEALARSLSPVEHTLLGLSDLAGGDRSTLEVVVDDRDTVQCLFTSGTTSRPKGVLSSHVAVTMAALAAALRLRCTEDDTAVVPLPLFHTAALNAILLPTLLTGGTAVLLPGYDTRAVLDALERRRATHALLLPLMWQDLLAQQDLPERDLSSLRLCLYGMAQMSPERIAEAGEAFGADVLLGSGQTEFLPPTVFQRPEDQRTKSGSWGTPTALTEVGIMDEDGKLLPAGETGEIVYRGPQCMTAYFGDDEATDAAFRHAWFHSGDVGHLDDEGVLWFTDRKKDMVKTAGENVASIEVERALLSHPAVTDCAVVGLPHGRWGEAVTAFVAAAAAEEELVEWCRERLAGFKVPKRIVAVEEFPRTGTGKIQKNVLRERARDLYR